MHPILVAFSANRKMEKELRQTERKIDREKVKMLHRIGREKTDLFDTYIRLNIRTPHPETGSTGTETVHLNRLELDTADILPKSIRLPLGRSLRPRRKHVTPVLDVEAGVVYCRIQGDAETRRKLEPDAKTNRLLYKNRAITRSLESVSGRDDAVAYGEHMQKMPRAKTTVGAEREVGRMFGFVRAATSIGNANRAGGNGACHANGGVCTRKNTITSGSYFNRSTGIMTKKEMHDSSLVPTVLETVSSSQRVTDKNQQNLMNGDNKNFIDIHRISDIVSDNEDQGKYKPRVSNSFQTLVYFNLGCMRLKQERGPKVIRRQPDIRSLLKGCTPPRGVPNMSHPMGVRDRR